MGGEKEVELSQVPSAATGSSSAVEGADGDNFEDLRESIYYSLHNAPAGPLPELTIADMEMELGVEDQALCAKRVRRKAINE